MHKRAIIRDYVVSLLINNTAALGRVYAKKVDPQLPSSVPYIIVKARRDRVLEFHGEESPMYQRTLSLQINIVTKDDEDVANDLADVVEGLILRDFTLGGNAVRAVLNDTELDPDANGADVYWDASINIDVDYISTFA